MGDGGQWTMAMNVYKKYGVVPKDLFPETESSKNTGENERAIASPAAYGRRAHVC